MQNHLGMSYIFLILTMFGGLTQVYNDADILEKILKDKRKELGPSPEEDDVGSPKLKLSKFDHINVFGYFSPVSKNRINFTLLPTVFLNVPQQILC